MSMGNGSGSGLGSGNGAGLGAGSGGNTGGGLRKIGGGVSAPVLLYQVEPQFSEEARKAKAAGNVVVNLWVDDKGNPTHVRVLRGVGMGLDEKAVEAVKQYRFKPAMEGGKPVTVEMNIEVNFQIF
jgi:protein TonB